MHDWASPIDQLLSLRVAVKYLLKRTIAPRERFEAATFPLCKYRAADFPKPLRLRFERIMSARVAVRHDYAGGTTLFEFNLLSSKEKRAIQSDIMDLYEACLLDIGRSSKPGIGQDFYEIAYPRDIDSD
jgi:hypothetical protein